MTSPGGLAILTVMVRGLQAVACAVCAIVLLGLPWSTASLRSQSEERIVTTTHQVIIDGKPLSYTARAGRLPIRDNETGDVHGQMFFIAYTAPAPRRSAARPLTFLWNGGPGSSSSLVHLLGFGPRRDRTPTADR